MKKLHKIILTALVIPALVLGSVIFPASAETSFTNAKAYVNVRSYGAKGDGATNDTAAIKKAINAAKSGGKTVFFPAGLYNVNSTITVPAGVNIEGITSATCGPWQNLYDAESKGVLHYNGTTSSNYWEPKMYAGSWIFVTDASGNVDAGGTFRLEGDNTVSRLGFVHMMNPPVYAAEITPTAPAISVDINKLTSTKGIVIEDITLSNPYYGIAVYQDNLSKSTANKKLSGKKSGPITIRNIMGAALYRGITVIGASDKVLIDNIQFNYTTYNIEYVKQHWNECIEVDVAASANVTVHNMLSYGAQTGIRTFSAYSGSPVNLNAISVNIEGEKPIRLEASGTQSVRNSYMLLNHFANASVDQKWRAITIKQDKSSSAKASYTLENIVFQDSVSRNSRMYDITLQGGATVNVISNLFWNFSNEPVISYVHESGASSKVTFTSLGFCSNKSGKLASVSGNAYKSGELTFDFCRLPSSIVGNLASATSGIKFKNCTKGYGSSSTLFSN